MEEKIERIGVCKNKNLNFTALFHRVKIKLSRKYRVWPVMGNDKSILLDPSEFMYKYSTIKSFKPE